MEANLQNIRSKDLPEFPQLCRFLADRSPQPMVAVEGLTHIVRYANPAFRKLLGKQDQYLVGRSFAEGVPEGMANGCAPLLDRVFGSGHAEALAEQIHGHKAAAENDVAPPAYWSYLAWPILGPGGAGEDVPVGVMIQVTDASEIAGFRAVTVAVNQKLLQAGLELHEKIGQAQELSAELARSAARERQAKQEAEAANRSKDLFLATLSHEMRTPLNAIVGWMSIVRLPGCTPEDLQEGLDVVDRNTRVQVQLIDDVLDVSRIVSGKLRLEVRPCDLTEVVKAGIDVVRPAADAKNINLTLQLEQDSERTLCDPVRMQQVVWNLLANAVKFTPRGGAVSVALYRDAAGLVIRVTDTGQGMSAELLPQIFERFQQGDGGTRRRFGGLGLGLSIVKQLVEMHGGTVDAASPGEGNGSTFTVRLPARADAAHPESALGLNAVHVTDTTAATRHSAAPLQLLRLDGLRILTVDDEDDARRLLTKVLNEAGATVHAAASAAAAMRLLGKAAAERLPPHILISDIGLPDEDGYDLIRQVRKSGFSARDLPAIALTAFVQKSDQRDALMAGFQVHIPKPVDPHELAVVIATLTGRTGSASSR